MDKRVDLSDAYAPIHGKLFSLKEQKFTELKDMSMLDLACEHFMVIYVNETPIFQVVCSPFQLKELAIGRLITEGILSSYDEIDTIYQCESGSRIKIFLKQNRSFARVSDGIEVPSCCTDNKTFYRSKTQDLVAVTPIEWNHGDIDLLHQLIKKGLPLHCATHAVHAAALAKDGELLCYAEDLGRHNALDKVVGFAYMNDIDLHRCILYTSGRVPVDMVSKVIRSGIPVLIGKGAPTVESVRLAQEYHLELVRCIPGGQALIY